MIRFSLMYFLLLFFLLQVVASLYFNYESVGRRSKGGDDLVMIGVVFRFILNGINMNLHQLVKATMH